MSPSPLPLRVLFCGAMLFCTLALVTTASAQKQEEGILVKVNRPGRANDEAFQFDGASKSFATTSSLGAKQANVHAFAFGHAATLGAGDGAFRSRKFNGADSFRTGTFATKTDRAGSQEAFASKDKSFGTKSVAVREAPAADKTMETKQYAAGSKLFEVRGKRQDTIDELHKDKNLTIDEVRAILNKPNGRPGGQRTPLRDMTALPPAS